MLAPAVVAKDAKPSAAAVSIGAAFFFSVPPVQTAMCETRSILVWFAKFFPLTKVAPVPP
jgi:hypothetical protein